MRLRRGARVAEPTHFSVDFRGVMNMRIQVLNICIVVVAVLAGACGSKSAGKGRSGAQATAAVTAARSTVQKQKPPQPTVVSTPPKTIPAAKQAGSSKIEAPAPSGELETWSFSDIDIDGDGALENGVAFSDSKTLYIAWTDADDLTGDGQTESYEALAWVGESVGIVIETGSHGALACAGSSCVACDSAGACSTGTAEDTQPPGR